MTSNRIRILMFAVAFCFASLNFASLMIGMSLQPTRVPISSFGNIHPSGYSYVCGNYNSTHYYAQKSSTGEYKLISTDAVSTISYALNSLAPGRVTKEKVLLDGNFTLNTYVNIPSYTILEIQGKLSTFNTDTYLLRTEGRQHIEIKGGSLILPSGTRRHAIVMFSTNDVLISGVEARGAGAIKLERCNRVEIDQCTLIGIKSCAILLMENSNDVDVLNNYIAGTAGTLIQGILTQGAAGCARVLIQENDITKWGGDIGCHGVYIGISYTHDIRIIRNNFHDALPSSGNAIRFDGTRGFISENTFQNLLSAYSCAFIGTAQSSLVVHNVTVRNNTVSNVVRGFYLYARWNYTLNNSITSNTIHDCSEFGVLLLGEGGYYVERCTVSDNIIYNCSNYGILLQTGTTDNTVTGNTVTECGTNIQDLGSGNHVYNNTIS